MAKQYIVIRGQIEEGKEVVAKRGEVYKPRTAAEEKRLVAAGVIGEAPGTPKAPEPASEQGSGQGGE